MPRKLSGFDAAALVKLAKVRHRLLDDPPPHPDAAHQTPITVDLHILLASRVAQIHAAKHI